MTEEAAQTDTTQTIEETPSETPDGTDVPKTEPVIEAEPEQEESFRDTFMKAYEEEQNNEKAKEEAPPEKEETAPEPETEAEPEDTPAEAKSEEAPEGIPELKEKLPWLEKVKGDINIDDPLERDAIEFWGGGKKAEWTKNRSDWDDEKKAKFAKYQSAYDHYRIESEKAKAQQEAQPQTPKLDEEEIKELTADLSKLIVNDEDTLKKYGIEIPKEDTKAEPAATEQKAPDNNVVSEKVIDKLSEAFSMQDTDQFRAGISELVSDVIQRAEDRASKAEKNALQSLEQLEEQKQKKKWLDQAEQDIEHYRREEGSAFTQYAQPIYRMLVDGYDQISGQKVNSVKEAYELCKRYDSGGSSLFSRPAPSGMPPKGSEGQPPSGPTEEDLNMDFRDYAHKVFKEEGLM